MYKYFKEKSKDAYGYGKINDIDRYIDKRYGDRNILLKENIILLPDFKMNELERDVENCTLTAIVRILKYYNSIGYKKIPQDINNIYRDIKEIAYIYGYKSKKGVFPTKIDNIISRILNRYGYSDHFSKAQYFWDFKTEILEEIDNGRPVILNIHRGYYRHHSVVVSGYKIFNKENRFYNMIIINDGWHKGLMFIDFNLFEDNLLYAGIGSFNKIRLK